MLCSGFFRTGFSSHIVYLVCFGFPFPPCTLAFASGRLGALHALRFVSADVLVVLILVLGVQNNRHLMRQIQLS